ncbi:hypothetical protein [Neptunomonas japonica]|uniref:RND family efflux transporter n=1 Tax=Neptunomonas japonica JAMM 1380 TaxID=1441457 RepID=A0A7R6PUT0_9GAMM|nr:hypothetical protein [Neptunomonas japonica]BBB30890.1 RND family efflux transporter [Neptunomonas japonica JAMM 1380]
MTSLMRRLPWIVLIFGSLTLGLAPFFPQPHLFEKVHMLINGELSRGIDFFDLFLHGLFPFLLILKAVLSLSYYHANKSANKR